MARQDSEPHKPDIDFPPDLIAEAMSWPEDERKRVANTLVEWAITLVGLCPTHPLPPEIASWLEKQ